MLLIAGAAIEIDVEGTSGFQGHAPFGKRTQPQLWSLEIGENTDRPSAFPLDRADQIVALFVILARAMAEVKAEHIGSGFE